MKYYKLKEETLYTVNAIEKLGEDMLLINNPQKFVITGSNGLYEHFHEKEAEKLGVKLFRGQFPVSGHDGGLYYADEDQIMGMMIIETDIEPEAQKTLVQEWMVKSLQDLGVETTIEGNDIILGGKKVGVTSGISGVIPEKLMTGFGLTLNLDLKTANACADYKHDLGERSTGINQSGHNITIEPLKDKLESNFNQFFDEELEPTEVPDLDTSKFQSDSWLKTGTLDE